MGNDVKQTYINRLGDNVGNTSQSLSRIERLLHDLEVKLQGNLPKACGGDNEQSEVIDIATLEGLCILSDNQANRAYRIAETFENLLSRL